MKTIASIFLLHLIYFSTYCQPLPVLYKAHSHNDYRQKKPLHNALENRFTSIEVDVYSRNNKLKVSHLPTFLFLKKDIETLYLKSLQKIIEENNGTIFKGDSSQITLMIDFKTDKEKIFAVLSQLSKKYAGMFETYSPTSKIWGPIKLLLTGNPPLELYLKDSIKFALIDGSLQQMKNVRYQKWFGRISANYKNHFLNTANQLTQDEQSKMKTLVDSVHKAGYPFRFWNTKNTETTWNALLNYGCDIINIDHLKKFREFYLKYSSSY